MSWRNQDIERVHRQAAAVLGIERPGAIESISVDVDFEGRFTTATATVCLNISSEDADRLHRIFGKPPTHDLWTYQTPAGVWVGAGGRARL